MEEKKKLQAEELREEELDTVVGGVGNRDRFKYKCNACGHTWWNYGNVSCCPSCTSTNISKT